MLNKRSTFILFTGCTLCGIAGFYLGKTKSVGEYASSQKSIVAPASLEPKPSVPSKPTDDAPTFEKILGDKDPFSGSVAFEKYVSSLNEHELALLLEKLAIARETPKRNSYIALVLRRCGMIKPEIGFQFAARFKDDKRAEYEGAVLSGWAYRDAAAAWEWVEKNPGVSEGRKVSYDTPRYFGILNTLENLEQFDVAGKLVDGVKENEGVKFRMLAQLSQDWVLYESKTALTWIDSLPEGRDKKTAMSNALLIIGRTDPDLAASYASMSNVPALRSSALSSAVVGWVQNKEPQKAFDAITRFGASPEADMAVQAYIQLTVLDDPKSAEKAMALFTSDKLKDLTLEMMVKGTMEKDPKTAAEWSLSFGQSTNRTKLVTSVVSTWAGTDKDAAIQFVESDNRLTQPEKDQLRTVINKKKK